MCPKATMPGVSHIDHYALASELLKFVWSCNRAKPVSKAPNENEFLFGSDFLHDHVAQIIDEPTVAVLELIANCYDAGPIGL